MRRVKILSKSKLFVFATILLILASLFVALELTDTTHLFRNRTAKSGQIPVINYAQSPAKPPTDTAKISASTGAGTVSHSDMGSRSQPSSPTSAEPPKPPFGSFVSNHYPSLHGSPAPSKERSVCNTSPGAICTITFTNNGGIIKVLPEQTADSNGVAAWAWDVNQAGFTEGVWRVSVMASLNGKTVTTNDSIDLKVIQ